MFPGLKPTFRVALAAVAFAAAALALFAELAGGINVGLIRVHTPFRPLVAACVAAAAYLVAGGVRGFGDDVARHRRALTTTVVAVLCACPLVAGLARNSWTAGGADSYAYVSQADRWLHFSLKSPEPLAQSAPWPDAIRTFTPHGYRPAPDGAAIVPMTAPGLPLLMALAKRIAGHCAMFWVTPLCGALLVWATFLIGRRVASDGVGLAAAWLTATSPTVLAMVVSPMSDVPAAAFVGAALLFAMKLGPDPEIGAPFLAGLAMAAAILIRANVAPVAIVIAAWLAWRDRRAAAAFVLGAAPAFILTLGLNAYLYGSPVVSGYGSAGALFSTSNISTNIARYGQWLFFSQTPLIFLAPLKLGPGVIFRGQSSKNDPRPQFLLLGALVAAWSVYLFYTPFDAWWYLRFLLPGWPAVFVGLALLLLAPRRPPLRAAGAALVLLLGLHGLYFADTHGAYPSGEGDHRYATIGKLAEQFTEPSAVIITGQNTGPVRYYGGRETLRFDELDAAWLDRSVEWLAGQHRHPYFLLEEWEIERFRDRFANASALGALAFAPVMAYRAPGVPGSVYLFDPLRRDAQTLRPPQPQSARAKCVEPALPVN